MQNKETRTQIIESITQKLNQKQYPEACTELDAVLVSCEEDYRHQQGKAFSFQHILDSYYFDYFFQKNGDYSYTEVNLNALYRMKSDLEIRLEHPHKAIIACKGALLWNPVDLDTILKLCELYKHLREPEKCRETALQGYNYCCTRATMSRFYRNLGFYYLEKQKPETAAALYLYSNIFFPSKQADGELRFLEQAGIDIRPQHVSELQQKLTTETLPLGPNPDTLGITYRVGCLELEAGHTKTARDCLAMVYDLTMDEEIGNMIP